MRTMFIAALIAASLPLVAQAQPAISVSSAVFVENATAGATRIVEKASYLSRGQRVILMMNWQATADGRPFTVMTPVPARLAFERSANGAEEVSVDGGRNWGHLGALRIQDQDGPRLAAPEDVTHLRWRLSGATRTGRLTWSALVR